MTFSVFSPMPDRSRSEPLAALASASPSGSSRRTREAVRKARTRYVGWRAFSSR